MKEDNQKKKSFKNYFTKKNIIITIGILILIGFASVPILAKASEYPKFCLSCHIMKPYYDSWESSKLLDHRHEANGNTCHDCHQTSFAGQMKEGINFISGNYTLPLPKMEVDRDYCMSCHTDFESIKKATAFEGSNPHDSHNGELSCNTCHNMHEPSQLLCAECHTFYWMKDLDESWNLNKK